MEAKEKAQELVNKFYYVSNPIADEKVRAMDWVDAVQCAKLCCDEIIEVSRAYYRRYYTEVKSELDYL